MIMQQWRGYLSRGCQQVQDGLQENKREHNAKSQAKKSMPRQQRLRARTTEPTLDLAHVFPVVHGACEFGLRILSFTPSMARSTSWVICWEVRPCQTGNIKERKGGTEKNNPSLKIGEYFVGSLVFGASASASGMSGGAAPKSGSFGNRQSSIGANVIGDCQRLVCLIRIEWKMHTGGPELNQSKSVDSE